MHEITVRDIQTIVNDPKLPWSELVGKTVLVTGASGQIGSAIVKTLLAVAETQEQPLCVLAHGRKTARLTKALQDDLKHLGKTLIFSVSDLSDHLLCERKPDMIIHAASVTSSQDFIDKPAETVRTSLEGTMRILNLALQSGVTSVVFVSTMEVYGDLDQETATETDCGLLDHLVLRNSYPCSKRMAEMLCLSYAREYGLNVKIVRPTQTFGVALQDHDNRVYAQFARAFLRNEPIILHTTGQTKRDYLYLYDAVHWILSVLLLGKTGEIYNLSNPATYCSIREMAELVAKLDPNRKLEIRYEIDANKNKKYLKELHRKLDTQKITALNSFPLTSLRECYIHTLILTQEEARS